MRKTKTTLITAIAIGLLGGSTLGVAAREDPVEVTGQVSFPGGTVETWATDDPRLTGTGTWLPVDGHPTQSMDYFLNGRVLETDDGTWRQLPVPQVNIPTKAEDLDWDMVLIGEGGYEGLVFIAQATWRGFSGIDVHGYIVDTTGS